MAKALDVKSVSNDIRLVTSRSPKLVNKIGIFGSLARGDYDNDSDIDILIEYAPTPDFRFDLFAQFCELCNLIAETLTGLYGRKVDIVHFENDPLNTLSDNNVVKEVLWL